MGERGRREELGYIYDHRMGDLLTLLKKTFQIDSNLAIPTHIRGFRTTVSENKKRRENEEKKERRKEKRKKWREKCSLSLFSVQRVSM